MTCDEQPDGGCEMGDTPRTDAAQGFIGTDDEFYKDTRCGNYVEVDHARTLERELSAARAELEACRADLAPRGLERAEPVTYGIDWGRKNGDRTVCSVFKLLPDGTKELIACEYQRAEYETQAFSESSGTVQVPRLVATAPKRIYLGVFDDIGVEQQDFPEDHEGITWCTDNVGHADVEYIRADLAAAPGAK